MDVPEDTRAPLDVTALRDQLVGGGSWRDVVVVTETGSTNADLVARAAAGEQIAGAVLFAEHQVTGKGRHGRSWAAVPRAQLLVSVGVEAAGVPSNNWGWLPLAAGVAVVSAAASVNVAAGLKWPNDVLATVDGGQYRKLAGILAEVAPGRSEIVVGIGLNVSLRASEVADGAAVAAAASLADLGASSTDRTAIAATLLHRLAAAVEQWRSPDGLTALRETYRNVSLTIGSDVRAELPDGTTVEGVAVGIDDDGRLLIDHDGDTLAMAAGDVAHLRAT